MKYESGWKVGDQVEIKPHSKSPGELWGVRGKVAEVRLYEDYALARITPDDPTNKQGQNITGGEIWVDDTCLRGMKRRYYAYQLVFQGDFQMGVDTDPGELWKRFVEDLRANQEAEDPLVQLEVGEVMGTDVEDALNSVRAGEWIEGTFVSVEGADE